MIEDARRAASPSAARSLGSGSRLHGFQDLSRFRIHDILLVSTLYDAFILTEDGQLSEGVLRRFLSFDAFHAPRLWHAATGAEALRLARTERRFDLVITAMHVGDMTADEFANELARDDPHPPVVALAYDARDVEAASEFEGTAIDLVCLWQGDVGILPAIVKLVEDRLNVAEDTGNMGVQAIILIEDNVRYYSSFLPVIYAELLRHSQSLVPEYAHDLEPALRDRMLKCFYDYRFPPEMQSAFEGADRFFPVNFKDAWAVVREVDASAGEKKDRAAFERASAKEEAARKKKAAEAAKKK